MDLDQSSVTGVNINVIALYIYDASKSIATHTSTPNQFCLELNRNFTFAWITEFILAYLTMRASLTSGQFDNSITYRV